MDQQKKKGAVGEVDLVIAGNLKRLRKFKNMSQDALASAMDVTSQQVQKYEAGVNRIGAGRLKDAADALGVTPNDFYYEGGSLEHRLSRLECANREARILLWVFEQDEARQHIDHHLHRTKDITEDDSHDFWCEVNMCFDAVVAGEVDEIEEFVHLVNFVNTLEPREKWIMPIVKDAPFQQFRSQLFIILEAYKKM